VHFSIENEPNLGNGERYTKSGLLIIPDRKWHIISVEMEIIELGSP